MEVHVVFIWLSQECRTLVVSTNRRNGLPVLSG